MQPKEINILISLSLVPQECLAFFHHYNVLDISSIIITISTNVFQIIFNGKVIILTMNNFFPKSLKCISVKKVHSEIHVEKGTISK
jgi:hypothetical protein